jgi:hypothetical protein
MSEPVKILSTEVAVVNTTPNTISSASLVRIVNTDGSNSCVIQLAYANGNVKGTFTLGQHGTNYSQEYIVKLPSDTIVISGAFVSAAGTVRATSVAYT